MYRLDEGTEVQVMDRNTRRWRAHKTKRTLMFEGAEKMGNWWLFTMIDWLILARDIDVKKEIPMRREPRHIGELLRIPEACRETA